MGEKQMRNTLGRKSLAVGIILLFVGVAVAPSINLSVVRASNDNDLVEVTTQACGIKGYRDTTVKLTREQYQNLEQYLIDFRAKLNQTTTREEAVPIFKEAVVELDKYGLLPKGMSVERAQRLVSEQHQNNIIMKLKDSLVNNHLSSLDNESNYFCLVAGKATIVRAWGPLFPILAKQGFLYHLIVMLFPVAESYFPYVLLGHFAGSLFSGSPIVPYGHLYFGIDTYLNHGHYNPSHGWIFSVGVNGIKNWFGDFYGGIDSINFPNFVNGRKVYYRGMSGFSGLKITFLSASTDVSYFLGGCVQVKVNLSEPV
jgi:hypothetical protein